MLQWQMKMCGEAAIARGHQLDDFWRAIHRLQRTDAERHVRIELVECLEQFQERRRRDKVAPVGSKVHARQRNLLEPGTRNADDLLDYIVERHASRRATRGWNDAVAAAFLAAGLHAKRERRSSSDARLEPGAVGCAMRCAFCLTGKMGIDRNLSAGEIAGQVRVLAGALGLLDRPFNIVLMGMGEPLHNYDATMKALRILSTGQGFAVSPRRVTLSTVGVLPALERLATEPFMPNLAISLHSTTEAQRDLLVPINRKYGIEELLDACRRFPIKRRQRITFEYVMLAGVNDTPDDAKRLARLLSGIQAKVNLLPLNEAAGIPFERPSEEAINRFGKILAERGVTVSVRKSRGRDIRAACGQLITESSKTAAPGKQLAMLM